MVDLDTFTNEELIDFYQLSKEHLGELETQFRSEVSLYGDAWPGAVVQVQDAQNAYNYYRSESIKRGIIYNTNDAPIDDIDF